MLIEVNFRDINKTNTMEERIVDLTTNALRRFEDRLTRVEVHVGDHNGKKPGPNDKRCLMEARPKGLDPVAVEAEGSDLFATINDAAGKLRRALDRRFEKHVATRVA